eukprot:6721022-Pyramimonas_sp.AAC.1
MLMVAKPSFKQRQILENDVEKLEAQIKTKHIQSERRKLADHEAELRKKRESALELLSDLKRKNEEEDEDFLMDDEEDTRHGKVYEMEGAVRRVEASSGSHSTQPLPQQDQCE